MNCAKGCATPGFAIANPDAAIALARPVGLRFLLPPTLVRRQGIFFPPADEGAAVEAAPGPVLAG